MDHNSDYGHKTEPQVLIQPNIRLDSGVQHSVVVTLSKNLVNDAMITPKIHYIHQYVSGAVSLEKDTLFDSQYIQPNNISDKIMERAWITGGLAMRGVEEFGKNLRFDGQSWDLPDVIDLEAAIRFLREDADKYSKE